MGAEGMVTISATAHHSRTITKRSTIVFFVTSIELSLDQLRPRLLGVPAQSPVETYSTICVTVAVSHASSVHRDDGRTSAKCTSLAS